MKVVCVGGGPATLYFSILLKLQSPSHDITVFERNPAGSTYGWGVTYWPDMLERLRRHDPHSASAISEESLRWRDGVAHVGERTTTHAGDEGFAIGRHKLLDILARRAEALGVDIEYGREVPDREQLPEADLIVAGDGANSTLRDRHAGHFGTHTTLGRNPYLWLGTTKVFRSFTFAFAQTAHGWIWCYAYGYSGEHSTCVVECSKATWQGLELDRLPQPDALRRLEGIFASLLDGHSLIGRSDLGGPAPWQTFRTLTNRTWSHGNLVLLGDAAHTTHYSIGAGTTLAMQDAMVLANSSPRRRRSSRRSATTSAPARASCFPSRARPGTAPSGTRTSPATSSSHRPTCSPCSASGTPRCSPTSRPSSTTGSTRPPTSCSHCADSSSGWDRASPAPSSTATPRAGKALRLRGSEAQRLRGG